MRLCLIDADAFIHARSLSLLELIRGLSSPSPRLVMTDRIASYDLGPLAAETAALETAGVLQIVRHLVRTKTGMYMTLVMAGIDKGEASAIAWLLDDATDRPVFVSCDRVAREEALRRRLAAWDLFDLVIELVTAGDVARDVVKGKLARWDDPRQAMGRPSGYNGFDTTFAERTTPRR
jgi:hypothetical protein